ALVEPRALVANHPFYRAIFFREVGSLDTRRIEQPQRTAAAVETQQAVAAGLQRAAGAAGRDRARGANVRGAAQRQHRLSELLDVARVFLATLPGSLVHPGCPSA